MIMRTDFIFLLSAALACAAGSSVKRRLPMMDIDVKRDVEEECFTPADFRERFLASCEGVLNEKNLCASAWDNFTDAFAFKDPSTVQPNNYDAYFEKLPVETDPNSVLFWSGVFDLARVISRRASNVNVTIASSFTEPSSAIINVIDPPVNCWCGNEADGIDYSNPCPSTPSFSFFVEFSSRLGESAKGIVFWVGYGEREGGAYRNDSFFANYEFPKLQSPRVTKLVVLDVHRAETAESCGEGTLALLQNLTVAKFGKDGYDCYDVNGDPNEEDEILNLADDVLKIISLQGNASLYLSSSQLLLLLMCLAGFFS